MSALLPLALMLAAPAQTSPLPPDVDDGWISGFLRAFREPPLWVKDAGKGYRARTRMSLMTNATKMVSLRIDERQDGTLIGTAVEVDRGMRGRRRVTRFGVSKQQMASLEAAFADLGLFTFARGSFNSDSACIDGMVMVFERVNADGYHHLEANAQCDAPPALRALARQWLAMADVAQFGPWLQ